MNNFLERASVAAPSKLTAFVRLWLVLQILVSVPVSIGSVAAMDVPFDHGSVVMVMLYASIITASTTIPVAIVAAVLFVVFGGLTK